MSRRRLTLTGRVVSDRMDKTVVVLVESHYRHRLYGKLLRRRKKYMAHDEANACHTGDLVRLEESRPLSRRKRWRVIDILGRAQGAPVSPITDNSPAPTPENSAG